MPLPDLRTLCIDLDVTPGDICITFPGGTEVCAHFPRLTPPDPTEIVRQLFAQINSALAPMAPIFNIIDAIVAVFDCIKAITTLDPKKILECIPNLSEKIAALLRLIPLLTIPVLLVQFLDILILFLRGQRNQMLRQAAYLQRILATQLASQRPGNLALARVIDCANADFENVILFMNEGLTPINRLIGLINFFMAVIGLEKYSIPDVSNIDPADLANGVDAIDLTIQLLSGLRAAIAPVAGQISAPFEAAAEAVES